MSPWLAAIPGSLALIVVGGLAVFVFLRMDEKPPASMVTAPPVAERPVAERTGVVDEKPAVEKTIEPISGDTTGTIPLPAPDTAPQTGSKKPGGTKKKRVDASDEKQPAEPAPAPEPVVEKPGEAAVEKPVEPVVEKPVVEKPVEVAEEKPVEQPAVESGPKKLTASFKLDAQLAVTKVDGGASKNRCEVALARHQDAMSICLRRGLMKVGTETSGTIDVKARVDVRGNLRNVEVKSNLPGVVSCLGEAYAPARLPAPDTGEAQIAFTVTYRATQE